MTLVVSWFDFLANCLGCQSSSERSLFLSSSEKLCSMAFDYCFSPLAFVSSHRSPTALSSLSSYSSLELLSFHCAFFLLCPSPGDSRTHPGPPRLLECFLTSSVLHATMDISVPTWIWAPVWRARLQSGEPGSSLGVHIHIQCWGL